MDALVSTISVILYLVIVVAYIVLYKKFMNLIKISYGFLDFMKMQTHAFFVFVFLILTLKISTTVISTIKYDIYDDSLRDYLIKSDITWLSIAAVVQTITEISYNTMMIVYLVQPYLEKDFDEDIEVNQAVRAIAGDDNRGNSPTENSNVKESLLASEEIEVISENKA